MSTFAGVQRGNAAVWSSTYLCSQWPPWHTELACLGGWCRCFSICVRWRGSGRSPFHDRSDSVGTGLALGTFHHQWAAHTGLADQHEWYWLLSFFRLFLLTHKQVRSWSAIQPLSKRQSDIRGGWFPANLRHFQISVLPKFCHKLWVKIW